METPNGTSEAQEKPQPKDLDVEEYKQSFSDFKTSISQKRDLKKRERDLKAHSAQTMELMETYKDQSNILANFDALVGEQQGIVAKSQRIIDTRTPEFDQASAGLKAAEDLLEETRRRNKTELAELKKQVDAKTSDLDAALTQARGTRKKAQAAVDEAGGQEGAAASLLEELQQALAASQASEQSAQEALKEAKAAGKRSYRDKKQACDEEERPIEDKVGKLKKSARSLQSEIDQAKKELGAADDRIAYCRQVAAEPGKVSELKEEIDERVAVEKQFRSEIDELAEAHSASKKGSTKARVVIAVAAVLAVAIVVAIVLNLCR